MTRVLVTLLFLVLSSAAGTFASPIMGMHEVSSAVLRYMGIIKVYEATLYVKDAHVDKDSIIAAHTSRCLKLQYFVSFKPEDFIDGGEAVMKRQHDPGTIAGLRQEIDAFHQKLREVKKGDSYTLCYDATTTSTTLFLNDENLVSIDSAEFATIYFGIWLGPTAPLDADLRDDLLEKVKKS